MFMQSCGAADGVCSAGVGGWGGSQAFLRSCLPPSAAWQGRWKGVLGNEAWSPFGMWWKDSHLAWKIHDL